MRATVPLARSPINTTIAQDADGIVARTFDPQFEMAEGKYSGYAIVNKLGKNADVDTSTTPEDIWEGGGLYTGFPNTLGEVLQVVSSSANDASAGAGARTIRVTGLDANYAIQTEDFTLNGTTPVVGVKTFTRVHTANILTSGSNNSAFNAGDITVRHNVTTANVFLVMSADTNQTNCSAYTVPAGKTAYMHRITGGILSSGGATYSADVSIFLQNATKSNAPRYRRPFTIISVSPTTYEIYGGLIFTEKTDIMLRVRHVSTSNIAVTGGYDLVVIDN